MAYIGKEPIVGNFQVCDAISVVNGQAAYTMQVSSTNVSPESANHMIVSLNGVIQKPGSSFTISGSTITFASNLATGDVIDFIILLGNVLDIGTVSDGTVTNAKLAQDIISGETELASEPADTDEFLVSDAGTLKRIDYSLIKSSPGLTYINSFTPSGSASTISLTNIFSSSYRNYRIVCAGLSIATNNSDMKYRFLTGSGSGTDHSSGYYWAIGTSNRNGTSVNESSDNDSQGRFVSNTSNDDGTLSGEFVIFNPNQSVKTTLTSSFIDRYEGSATAHTQQGGCWVNAGDSFTGIRLFGGSNFDALGKITVYGMADS